MLEATLVDNIVQNEFSVSEISYKIKSTLENNIGRVRVKGEISGLKIASSGHCYFSLKDSNAVLAATCWRHVVSKMNFQLQEGLEVIVTGSITAYGGQSKYQISADLIEPSGVGALMKILQERKENFAKEGLFDAIHKKPLPFIPKRIGVITSPTGAVIHDMIHRISDRYPTHVLLWPVSVQGASSASEVVKAIQGFNKLSQELRPEVLIIARGGGSIEDLWSFNEEFVVRAAFASEIPIISAIGHETDYSLLDFVADLRAPTPTAAAEFAVPVLSTLLQRMQELSIRLPNRVSQQINYYTERNLAANAALKTKSKFFQYYSQKVDEAEMRLESVMLKFLTHKNTKLEQFTLARLRPYRLMKYKYLEYQHLASALRSTKDHLLRRYDNMLHISGSMLMALDHRNVLKRGFAIVKSENGDIISSLEQAKYHKKLELIMQDGSLTISI